MYSVNVYNVSKLSSLLQHTCKENWIYNFVDQEALYHNYKFNDPEVGVLTRGQGHDSHICFKKSISHGFSKEKKTGYWNCENGWRAAAKKVPYCTDNSSNSFQDRNFFFFRSIVHIKSVDIARILTSDNLWIKIQAVKLSHFWQNIAYRIPLLYR